MPDEKIEPRKRRCVIAYIPMAFLETMLKCFKGGEYIQVPIFEDLPEDIEICRMTVCYDRESLAVVIRHPSFEETPEYAVLPAIEVRRMTFKKIRVEKVGD